MGQLANGLSSANHEETLSVREAELSMMRRLGAPEAHILATQSNLANTYARLGEKKEQALRMRRDVYTGYSKLKGEEQEETLIAASNYAMSLAQLRRWGEARSLLRRTMPVALRVLGGNHEYTLMLRKTYGRALSKDPGATLDDVREAVTTLEDAERISRRVLGRSHPTTAGVEGALRAARAKLRTRETPSKTS